MHRSDLVEESLPARGADTCRRQRRRGCEGSQTLVDQARLDPEGPFELGSEAPATRAERVFGAVHVRWQAHYQECRGPLPDQAPDVLQPRTVGYGADGLEGMGDAESQFAYCDADASRAEIEG